MLETKIGKRQIQNCLGHEYRAKYQAKASRGMRYDGTARGQVTLEVFLSWISDRDSGLPMSTLDWPNVT